MVPWKFYVSFFQYLLCFFTAQAPSITKRILFEKIIVKFQHLKNFDFVILQQKWWLYPNKYGTDCFERRLADTGTVSAAKTVVPVYLAVSFHVSHILPVNFRRTPTLQDAFLRAGQRGRRAAAATGCHAAAGRRTSARRRSFRWSSALAAVVSSPFLRLCFWLLLRFWKAFGA